MRDHDEVFRRVMEAKEQYEQKKRPLFVLNKSDAGAHERRKESGSKVFTWAMGAVAAAVMVALIGGAVTVMSMKGKKKPVAKPGSEPTETVTPKEEDKKGSEQTKLTDAEIAASYFPEDYAGYRYPVLAGMTTWPKGNHAEMVKACQIPEDTLKGMSSENLVQTVLFYPLFPDVLAYDSIELGYPGIKANFNGLAELCKRDDRIAALKAVVKAHKDWFFKGEPATEGEEVVYKDIHLVVQVLLSTSDFAEAYEDVARELKYTEADIDFNTGKDPDGDSFVPDWSSESRSVYQKALADADAEQREKLEHLRMGRYPYTSSDQCIKQIQIIRGILPADTPNITLSQAEEICNTTEKEFIGTGAKKLIDRFNAIAGAPDLETGSSEDRLLIYYTNEEQTSYVRIHWIYAQAPETSVEYFAEDGSERQLGFWK